MTTKHSRQAILGCLILSWALCVPFVVNVAHSADDLQPVQYNNPGLVVDLGVGLWAWPLPMDYDNDGDLDLVVSCPDKPYNGTYFFENTGDDAKMPVFKPAVKIGRGHHNIRVSHVAGGVRVLTPGREYRDFRTKAFEDSAKLPLPSNIHEKGRKIRANQWKYVDYDGDGALDLTIGVGDWADYGWDDAYNDKGQWTNGPLHGFVYWARNTGTTDKPRYAEPVKVQAGGQPVDVFGWPSPEFVDMDNDGDLDLLCGEFLDRFMYFENTGSRTAPQYETGRFLTHNGSPIRMDLQMIVPAAIDWDADGDIDLIVGDEDGRVAFVENTGKFVDSLPQFLPPKYFQQQADGLKFGALATPFGIDWDGDGDDDLLCGNTAGYIGFFENLGGGDSPKWANVQFLQADDAVIRIQAGPNGSIQGPCEAKWGYTTLSAADWNHDGLPDIMINSIWGEILWYENVGTRTSPRLKAAQKVSVDWPAAPPKPSWNWWHPGTGQLVTQWRTTPEMIDFNQDGLTDLVMLDHEGYLSYFERKQRNGKLSLAPGQRIFTDEKGELLQLNPKRAGGSGRRKIHVVDWDGDGRFDLLANSSNADLYHNVSNKAGKQMLKNMGPLGKRPIAGHTSSPATVDWNKDGKPDLVVGAEDGRIYYMQRD